MPIQEEILIKESEITDFRNQDFKGPYDYPEFEFKRIRGNVRLWDRKVFGYKDFLQMIEDLLAFKLP